MLKYVVPATRSPSLLMHYTQSKGIMVSTCGLLGLQDFWHSIRTSSKELLFLSTVTQALMMEEKEGGRSVKCLILLKAFPSCTHFTKNKSGRT